MHYLYKMYIPESDDEICDVGHDGGGRNLVEAVRHIHLITAGSFLLVNTEQFTANI